MTEEKNEIAKEQRVSPKLLEQALKTCDESIIKFVLEKTSEEQINSFVEPIPFSLLPIFLRTFNKFINAEPDYLKTVIPWISSLIDCHQTSISASGECQRRIAELQMTLKQRTQQIGLFVEANSSTEFIQREREGKGVGLPITDDLAQEIVEE